MSDRARLADFEASSFGRNQGHGVKRFDRQETHASRRWRLRALRRRSSTRWLLGFAVLVMLGMQIATAAYACAMVPSAMGRMASDASMQAMGGSCPEMHGLSDRLLCQQHCAPDNTAKPDVSPTSVPQSLLTALPPLLPAVAIAALPAGHAPERLYRLRASPPPATLLFCSLLI